MHTENRSPKTIFVYQPEIQRSGFEGVGEDGRRSSNPAWGKWDSNGERLESRNPIITTPAEGC